MAKQSKSNPKVGDFGPIYTQFEGKPKEATMLLAAQHNMYSDEDTPDYKTIGAVARLMGSLCNDMTIIQEELYG